MLDRVVKARTRSHQLIVVDIGGKTQLADLDRKDRRHGALYHCLHRDGHERRFGRSTRSRRSRRWRDHKECGGVLRWGRGATGWQRLRRCSRYACLRIGTLGSDHLGRRCLRRCWNSRLNAGTVQEQQDDCDCHRKEPAHQRPARPDHISLPHTIIGQSAACLKRANSRKVTNNRPQDEQYGANKDQ